MGQLPKLDTENEDLQLFFKTDDNNIYILFSGKTPQTINRELIHNGPLSIWLFVCFEQ